MASKNGCNSDMVKGPVGFNSTRINPAKASGRNSLSKGGVNDHLGGTKVSAKGPVAAGKAGQGKMGNDKR